MKRLIVYLNSEPVGTLDQDQRGLLSFCYGPDWLNRPDATSLSRSLPLRNEPFQGRTINLDGTVTRVHQEDFCQALGFPPERKYQQEGGPLLRDCIAMLRERSTVAALDIRDFLDDLIFNVLIGNADAHGKNYSIL